MARLENKAYALWLAERSEFELGADDMEDFAFMASIDKDDESGLDDGDDFCGRL